MDENLPVQQPVYKTFEEALPVIDKILKARKGKWLLKARADIDYEDVSQLCRLHIWKKWSQYDSTQPLEPWVARIVTRQAINLIRNVYSAHSRPCLKCAENQGGDLCGAFGKQCSECPLFALWERTKKRAFNVKLPVSMENHLVEVFEMPDNSVNVERAVQTIFENLKPLLKPNELLIFQYIYMDHLSDEQVAEKMGFCAKEERPSENYSQRKPGYGRISQIKRKILEKVREIKDEIDIF